MHGTRLIDVPPADWEFVCAIGGAVGTDLGLHLWW
jgi:hypothetical protein